MLLFRRITASVSYKWIEGEKAEFPGDIWLEIVIKVSWV